MLFFLLMNLYKILFSSTLMMGTILSISSYSWMSMWMGLEINLLSIIPLMNNNQNKLASESSLKYFITQTIASAVLLYAMIMQCLSLHSNEWLINLPPSLISLSLLMKMGAAPLHFWFPEVMEGLTWMNSLIMMTWQKIAPLFILINLPMNSNIMMMFIISSITIGGLMGINQSSMRKILAYSSINHVGWMLSALITNLSIWMNYFCIYSFISFNLVYMLKTYNILYAHQMFSSKTNLLKITFLSNLLSMGGVPPFLGFFPKWIILSTLTKNNITLATFMVVMTLITLFLYIRTIIPSLTLVNTETKVNYPPKASMTMWWMNGMNLLALILCTAWFNLN